MTGTYPYCHTPTSHTAIPHTLIRPYPILPCIHVVSLILTFPIPPYSHPIPTFPYCHSPIPQNDIPQDFGSEPVRTARRHGLSEINSNFLVVHLKIPSPQLSVPEDVEEVYRDFVVEEFDPRPPPYNYYGRSGNTPSYSNAVSSTL